MFPSLKTRFSASGILLLAVFIPSISAAYDIKDYFNVATSGSGSCEEYLPAFAIASAGYSVVKRIEENTATFTDARHYYMMFSADTISVHKGKRDFTEGEKVELEFVKEILKPINRIQIKARNPRSYCDSTFLTYTEMAYDETTGEKTDKSLVEIGIFPPGWPIETKGAYWSADDKAYTFELDASAGKTPCSGITDALRINNLQTIILCPRLLEGDKKQELKPYARGRIAINNEETLDSFNSIPGTFMHEMVHMVSEEKVIDQQALDRDGKPVPGKLTYGINAIANLAVYKPNLAMLSADTYHYFAMASYLKTKDWAAGRATDFKQVSSET